MNVNKLADLCLIILGIVNVLHEFVVRSTGRGEPISSVHLTILRYWKTALKILSTEQTTSQKPEFPWLQAQ